MTRAPNPVSFRQAAFVLRGLLALPECVGQRVPGRRAVLPELREAAHQRPGQLVHQLGGVGRRRGHWLAPDQAQAQAQAPRRGLHAQGLARSPGTRARGRDPQPVPISQSQGKRQQPRRNRERGNFRGSRAETGEVAILKVGAKTWRREVSLVISCRYETARESIKAGN